MPISIQTFDRSQLFSDHLFGNESRHDVFCLPLLLTEVVRFRQGGRGEERDGDWSGREYGTEGGRSEDRDGVVGNEEEVVL